MRAPSLPLFLALSLSWLKSRIWLCEVLTADEGKLFAPLQLATIFLSSRWLSPVSHHWLREPSPNFDFNQEPLHLRLSATDGYLHWHRKILTIWKSINFDCFYFVIIVLVAAQDWTKGLVANVTSLSDWFSIVYLYSFSLICKISRLSRLQYKF